MDSGLSWSGLLVRTPRRLGRCARPRRCCGPRTVFRTPRSLVGARPGRSLSVGGVAGSPRSEPLRWGASGRGVAALLCSATMWWKRSYMTRCTPRGDSLRSSGRRTLDPPTPASPDRVRAPAATDHRRSDQFQGVPVVSGSRAAPPSGRHRPPLASRYTCAPWHDRGCRASTGSLAVEVVSQCENQRRRAWRLHRRRARAPVKMATVTISRLRDRCGWTRDVCTLKFSDSDRLSIGRWAARAITRSTISAPSRADTTARSSRIFSSRTSST